ncbi:MAG: GerMN domain-containing protein [Sedimentibacter sp.]|uniref:GerMN domain-containing protein n=1 Tax=Sedimentibacter sp. TaxID=1960295 RepID=UPI0029827D5D|nr:GerMN domain-containing protein [Sedimentibacter sp.]MDW5299965.1 GerMN domain-containing protein [Sedimentibacter sp.]
MKNLLAVILISALLIAACENEITTEPENNVPETPTPKIEDYYPFTENTKCIFEGEKNEFAYFTTYIDYVNNNRIQTRTDNGGTQIVKVMEIKEGQLIQLFSRGETYFRENFTDNKFEGGKILLKEPLKEGNSWSADENSTSTITSVSKEVVTKKGNFDAIEVTTKGKQGKTVDYYVKDMGLVKTVNYGEGYEVSSTLSSIEKNQPFIQSITLYYPNVDGVTLNTIDVQISFNTNDEPEDIIEKNIKDLSIFEVLSTATKINNLNYNEEDNSVHVDLSKEFVTDMNAGASFEAMILQSITNTLGAYYGVQNVYITIDDGPYESGHIIIEKGEPYKVDLKNVKPVE